MIKTFKCADTEALFNRQRVARFVNFEAVARRKLEQSSGGPSGRPTCPRGNGLEALKGDRAGQHSIRVNDQFRVCFRWTGTDAEDARSQPILRETDHAQKSIAPYSPRQILLDEFLKPLGICNTGWRKKSACPPSALGTSWRASAPSPKPTPISACVGSSVCLKAIGCGTGGVSIPKRPRSTSRRVGEDQAVGKW